MSSCSQTGQPLVDQTDYVQRKVPLLLESPPSTHSVRPCVEGSWNVVDLEGAEMMIHPLGLHTLL